jgi:hypothetical protein
MRQILSLFISLLVGFAVGFAWFRGSAPLRMVTPGHDAPADTVQAGAISSSESNEPTDAKAQRIIAAILRSGESLERRNELYLAIQALTANDFRNLLGDPGALKAMAERLSSVTGSRADILANAIIARWLAVDPGAVMTWAPRALDLISSNEQERKFILNALAKKRPEDVLKLASTRKSAEERADLISSGLRELAAQNPARARAWLDGCTDPKDRTAAEKAMRAGTVQADPLRAVELAGAAPDREEGIQLLGAAVQQAAKMGSGIVRQLASTPMPGWMLSQVLFEFAQRDPEAAVDLAAKQPLEGNEASWGMEVAFAQLAARDRSLAFEKMQTLTGASRSAAIAAIASEWGVSEPAAALDWVGSFPASERKNAGRSGDAADALLSVFQSWATSDPVAAGNWAEALPPGETRDRIQAQRARALSTLGDMAGAAKVLSALNSPDPKALSEVARQWTQRDPQAAADWAIAQPSGPQQSRALASVVETWANDDPQHVQDWLAQFPPGETRDRSVAAFLLRAGTWGADRGQVMADFDQWFDTIEDPWQRARVAQRSYWIRRQSDPAGARTWLSSLPNVDPELVRKTLRKTY